MFGGLHLSPLSLAATPPFNYLYAVFIPLFVDAVTVTTDCFKTLVCFTVPETIIFQDLLVESKLRSKMLSWFQI